MDDAKYEISIFRFIAKRHFRYAYKLLLYARVTNETKRRIFCTHSAMVRQVELASGQCSTDPKNSKSDKRLGPFVEASRELDSSILSPPLIPDYPAYRTILDAPCTVLHVFIHFIFKL